MAHVNLRITDIAVKHRHTERFRQQFLESTYQALLATPKGVSSGSHFTYTHSIRDPLRWEASTLMQSTRRVSKKKESLYWLYIARGHYT